MSVDRYTNLWQNDPTTGPGYSPLPFNEIAAAGQAKQKRYDSSIAEEDAISQLQAKVKPLDNVTGYGPNGGFGTFKTGQSEEVQQHYNGLRNELSQMAESIAKGDKGNADYKRHLDQIYNRESALISPSGKFGQYTQDATEYEKQQDELAKNKDAEEHPWLANKAYSNVQGYLQGKNRISTQPIGQAVDRNEEFNKGMAGMQEQINTLYERAINGRIEGRKVEDVSAERVDDTFDKLYENSNSKKDFEEEANHRVMSGQINRENANKSIQDNKAAIKQAMIDKYTKSTGTASLKDDEAATKKAQDETPVVGKHVTAPVYGTKTVDNNSLTKAKTDSETAVKTEMSKILYEQKGTDNDLMKGASTAEGLMTQLDKTYKGGAIQYLKDNSDKIDNDKHPAIKNLLQNYDDIQQREQDAKDFADNALKSNKNYKMMKDFNDININGSSPAEIRQYLVNHGIEPEADYVTKDGKVDDNTTYSLNTNIGKIFKLKGYNASEDWKTLDEAQNSYKDKTNQYLKETSQKTIPLNTASSQFTPINKDASGKLIPDTEYGEKITKDINTTLHNGGFDTVPTTTSDGKNGFLTIGQLLDLTKDKNGKNEEHPKMAFYTALPNENGKREVQISIGGKDVRVEADQLSILSKDRTTQTSLGEIQNTPEQKLNDRIFRAYNNGSHDIKFKDGTHAIIPESDTISENDLKNGTFANNSNIKVILTSEESAKFEGHPKILVGDTAIKYLIKTKSKEF